MIVEGRAHADLLAALHAGSFGAGEQWDAPAMATLLDMPGCFACLQFAPVPVSTPAGMALVRVVADEAELLTIAVLPSLRKSGTGRALLCEAQAEASRRGGGRMFLEVAVPNVAARALYRACGFQQVGQRRAYYPDGSDALLLSGRTGDRLSACGS